MLKILFIGDIVGKIGRETVKKILPKLKKEFELDYVIANGENTAHGTGVTKQVLEELTKAGINYFTNGDHALDKEKQFKECLEAGLPVLRPANYPVGVPGKGYAIIEIGNFRLLLINLLGRVFMNMDYDCPFKKFDEIYLAEKGISGIIIDIHAEATSEKIALRHYVDGKASAILGTHTHVMTADNQITSKGTAYITDVGMTGFADGCIGVDKVNVLETFLTQIKKPHQIPETGKSVFNAVLISLNKKTGKATSIKPITKFTEIK